MAHRDEAGVRGQVLERQRVERPKDEHREDASEAESGPSDEMAALGRHERRAYRLSRAWPQSGFLAEGAGSWVNAAMIRLAPVLAFAKQVVRYLAAHTGLPALLVAAILLVLGWRLLQCSARFLAQVMVVSLVLIAASEFGWIRW
jgi:hypothetical protein